MNQAPAADANRAVTQTKPPPSGQQKIEVFPSAKLLMLPPVLQDGIKAEMVLITPAKGSVVTPGRVYVAMVLTIPTKWSPPTYDEDAEPWDKINPYDRVLVLPPLPADKFQSRQATAQVHLLNMFQQGPEVNGKIIMPRREGDSGNFSFWSGGYITSFIKQAIMLAAKRGCKVKLQQAVADNAKTFLSGADFPIKMVFVFEPEGPAGVNQAR